jgi:hypothetical protein
MELFMKVWFSLHPVSYASVGSAIMHSNYYNRKISKDILLSEHLSMFFISHSVVLLKKSYRRSNSVNRSKIQRFYFAHVKPTRCEIRRLIIKFVRVVVFCDLKWALDQSVLNNSIQGV